MLSHDASKRKKAIPDKLQYRHSREYSNFKSQTSQQFFFKIFGFLISLSPTMATTTFIKDRLVQRNLKHIAYIGGALTSLIAILGFTVAFSKNRTFVIVAIVVTSICLITLVSLAAHAFTYLGYHVALVPTTRVLALMNRTWIGVEGDNFQRAVSIQTVPFK